jgi:5-methylcytosine-specific restriction protein A
MVRNKSRWQVAGNSNIFDSDLDNDLSSKYITYRNIIILEYINQNRLITISDFEKNIWNIIEFKIGKKRNNSNIRHFYRPLQFYGLIQEFENKLFLSQDGEMMLKYLEDKDFNSAKNHFILQLLKVRYPNKAVKQINLKLYPFRILFKILINKEYITDNDLIYKIPYIINKSEYELFNSGKLLNNAEYNKFKIWIISSLIKLNILSQYENKYYLNSKYKNLIGEAIDNFNVEDLFFSDDFYQGNFNYKYKRNAKLAKKIIKNSDNKCFIDKSHITFPTNKVSNYLEIHHMIPLNLQSSFLENLDVEENLVAICPNCHQAFHRANNDYKISLINKAINNGYNYFDKYKLIEAYKLS